MLSLESHDDDRPSTTSYAAGATTAMTADYAA